ncbi:MAG TPA: hypothetical protein VGC38_04615 [Pseudolabrys sp.]
MSIDGALNGLLKLAIAAAVIGAGAFAVMTVLDQLALDRKAAERRALIQRNAELNVSAVAPGSVLACLDGGAGEVIENACEKAIFANPQSAAAAVSYTAARLALIADAQALARADPGIVDAFASTQRALELDRYGLAAHVLAVRDGCTAEHCAAFAWLHDSAALKGNLRAEAFDSYVARYAASWNADKPAPVASVPPPADVASAPAAPGPHPVSSKYDFPSAASIPPVSIMNAEPPPPKDPAAPPVNAGATATVPAPPKRPQAQAAPPPPAAAR